MLHNGDKVLVIHRRLFEEDQLRFFVGIVNEYDNGIAAVTGHSWIQDVHRGAFTRKADMRGQIISLTSGSLIVYKLSKFVNLDNLTFEYGNAGEPLLTDGGDFRMDLTDRMRST